MTSHSHRLHRLTSSGRGLHCAAAVLLWTLVAAPLCGHAAFPEFHSIKTTITAEDGGVHVLAAVEIPLADLVLAFNRHFEHLDLIAEIQAGRIEELENEFRDATFEALAEGLELTIDGRPASWRPVETPINGRAGEGFFVYLLESRFEAAPRALDVSLVNGLYPDVDLVLANLVQATSPWTVESSTVPPPPAGADLTEGSADELALWDDDPAKRRFRVRLDSAR